MRCAKAAYHDDEDVDEAINNIIIIRASPFFAKPHPAGAKGRRERVEEVRSLLRWVSRACPPHCSTRSASLPPSADASVSAPPSLSWSIGILKVVHDLGQPISVRPPVRSGGGGRAGDGGGAPLPSAFRPLHRASDAAQATTTYASASGDPSVQPTKQDAQRNGESMPYPCTARHTPTSAVSCLDFWANLTSKKKRTSQTQNGRIAHGSFNFVSELQPTKQTRQLKKGPRR